MFRLIEPSSDQIQNIIMVHVPKFLILITNICCVYHHHHHHHHYHTSVTELGHLLKRSSLTYPEVSSNVCHNSFCQLENSVSLPWVSYYEAFYLHVMFIDWINYYIIAKHSGMAPIKYVFLVPSTIVGTQNVRRPKRIRKEIGMVVEESSTTSVFV